MKLTPKQAAKIAEDCEQTAKVAQLVYFNEHQLTIFRKKYGRGFIYLENEKKISDKRVIQRIKNLVIPPAWQEVWISPIEDSHLQAIGRDAKGRKQYRYHPRWNQIRNSTKFFRMISFGEALPQLRRQIDSDLKIRKMTKEKCLALILRLMEETHIRIGSDQYAKTNKTYGLSTMRTRHLVEENGQLYFQFVGKKGKKHNIPVEDRKLRRLVIQCEEIPGWELFQYWDENGNHQAIDSGMVNDYIQRITQASFTAKDFRTWAASKIFLETLENLEEPASQTQREKNIVEACKVAAMELGNTRTVCKNYYIHPALIQAYENGRFKQFRNVPSRFSDELQPSEKFLLNIIENYSFEISE
ncbi:MAG TPA: DNA topoisomerase IB [Flavobacteriaceae bacterium]|nr:DNA topoisomerase IB [Flavobacteriaceae bacterium]